MSDQLISLVFLLILLLVLRSLLRRLLLRRIRTRRLVSQWKEMLDRDDVLIVDISTNTGTTGKEVLDKKTGMMVQVEVVEVGVLDSQGRQRFPAAGDKGSWRDLLAVLRDARVVLEWDSNTHRMIEQTASLHAIPFPALPWKEASVLYNGEHTIPGSMAGPGGQDSAGTWGGHGGGRLKEVIKYKDLFSVAKHEGVEYGQGTLGRCLTILAIMRVVVRNGGARITKEDRFVTS